jgi:hypothetical protein
MTLTQLIHSAQGAQFVVDAQGNKKAVLLDLAVWEEILSLLQELEQDEVDEQLWDERFASSPDVLEKLAAEARAERQAGRVKELDPDS